MASDRLRDRRQLVFAAGRAGRRWPFNIEYWSQYVIPGTRIPRSLRKVFGFRVAPQ